MKTGRTGAASKRGAFSPARRIIAAVRLGQWCRWADRICEYPERFVVRHDYALTLPLLTGEHRFEDYPDSMFTTLSSGRVIVAADTKIDPDTAMMYVQGYEPIGVRALIAVPFLRDGRWMSTLAATSDVPRTWQPREVRLLETVAERIWLAIEKLRTDAALRASEERLHILYAQEQSARQEAEAANRLKDDFLATVSHELRTPLTSILGYAQLLQTRQRDPAYTARTVDRIVRSAQAQAQLIEDLLDVSRIVTGKLRLDRRTVNLIGVIHMAIDTVRPTLDAKALRLELDLNPEVSIIVGDSNRLQQIVWNLLINAAKFTPHGGVIRISLQSALDVAELQVSDTGQGIATEFLPYVFDRFRRAESTSNRTHGGLGLGLSIVRHLVEMHGGTVHVESAGPGTGTTFTVRLPLLASDDNSEPSEPQLAWEYPPKLAGLRLLVVDDQPDILELIEEVFTPAGTIVRLCASATEGLATLRAWQPDLLISDIAMPGEDGYWLIDKVRALPQEEGGAIPAVALTAYVRVEDRTRVLAAGFQMYVPKPIEPTELISVVASLVAPPGEKVSLPDVPRSNTQNHA